MTANMYMLGIDVGSTFLKSSVLELERRTVAQTRSIPTPEFADRSAREREIPMAPLAQAVKELIDQAARECPLEGIVLSVQMHGFLLFDRRGRPSRNYVSWQDMRAFAPGPDGLDAAAEIAARVPAGLLREDGVVLKNTHSLCPLHRLLSEHPAPDGTSFAMLGDALTWYLTGTRAPVHPTVAASSGLYSLTRRDWNRELAESLGLNVAFPAVYDGRDPVASYRSPRGELPVYAAVGDHQAAVLGTCVDDRHVLINIGTGGQISYLDDGLAFGEYETRPYFGGRTLRAFTQRPSGRSLSVLTDFVLEVGRELFGCEAEEAEVWKQINRLTDGPDKNEGGGGLHVDLSFFDAEARGSVGGIDSHNLRVGNLFRAAYACMTEEYYSAYRRLLSDGCAGAAGVVCTGGVMRKTPLLQRMISERFGVPCRMAPFTDDTMVGLTRLARWHLTGESLSEADAFLRAHV